MVDSKKISAAADKVQASYTGQRYIAMADRHDNSDNIMAVAIEMARRLNKPVGVEFLTPADQVYIDAFRNGEISRDRLVAVFSFMKAKNEGDITQYSPQYYMGMERGNQSIDDLVKAIESGVNVVCLGSSLGQDTMFTNTARKAELTDNIEKLETRLSILVDKFNATERSKRNADPSGYFYSFYGKVLDHFSDYSEAQQKAIADLVKDLTPDKISTFKTIELFEITQPEWDEQQRNKKELARLAETDPNGLDDGIQAKGVDKRLYADSVLANTIMARGGQDGMVIVMGLAHFTHSKAEARDIDSAIRAAGERVMIIDTLVGAQNATNSRFAREVEASLKSSGLLTSEWNDLQNQMLRLEVMEEVDPDRFTLDLDNEEVIAGPPPPLGAANSEQPGQNRPNNGP